MQDQTAKRVLIIAYYWPPSGGAGVQRWLKFVKYLPEFGIKPYVYVPENGDYPIIDNSLEQEIPNDVVVVKRKIWEPFQLYRWFTGKSKGYKMASGAEFYKINMSFSERISVWVRGNFFIPDARQFWVKPSIQFLENYIQQQHIDTIVSSGPPHSMHLIALGLKKRIPNLKWVADFRDPWTGIDFYHDLKLSSWADSRHKKLEYEVLSNADSVLTISKGIAQDLSALGARHTMVLPNGYDDEDFENKTRILDPYFSIVYVGTMNLSRNPDVLWRVLNRLCQQNLEFSQTLKITLIGQIDPSVIQQLQNYELQDHLIHKNYVPHADVIQYQLNAQVLLLAINQVHSAKKILTGKVFEYLATGRPIISIGPKDGDAAMVLLETGCGQTFENTDELALENYILSLFKQFQTKKDALLSDKSLEKSKKYSRKTLSKALALYLSRI
jgi:glycosyltransferase involved in cell wall biosynthesis